MTQPISERYLHALCQKAIDLKGNIEGQYLELAKTLYEIHEASPQTLGEIGMELGMSAMTVSKFVRIHKVFVLEGRVTSTLLSKVGWSVLAEALPSTRTPRQADRDAPRFDANAVVGSLVGLTQQDARRTILEARTGVDMTKCEHPEAYTLRICPDCKDRWKVYDEEK